MNFAGINTSSVIDFNHMFSGCSSLASLDLSSFDTAAAKNLSYLFYGCSSLESPDLSSFDTAHVETMADLFTGCSKLAEVTLGESFAWVGSKCFLPQPNATFIPGADGLWHAASDGASYRPSAVPGNKADTYRAVAPGGEGNAVEGDAGGADVVNGADPTGAVESANGAGAAEDSGNAGRAGSESAADVADTAPGASAPDSENHAIAVEGLAAAEREDYMTALAMANPSAAAPSVVA